MNRARQSSPDNECGVDPKFAPFADGLGHRHRALLAVGTRVRIEQNHAVLPECGIAMRTGMILPFEVPCIPALWTAVMWDDLHFTIHDVTLWR